MPTPPEEVELAVRLTAVREALTGLRIALDACTDPAQREAIALSLASTTAHFKDLQTQRQQLREQGQSAHGQP